MLAFMAYPPPRNQQRSSSVNSIIAPPTTSAAASTHSVPSRRGSPCSQGSATTASGEDRHRQSLVSLSTEASSSAVLVSPEVADDQEKEQEVHRRAQNCCVDEPPTPPPSPQRQSAQHANKTQMYFDRLYGTVHGPCHGAMCELEHMDLFLNCQQPLSFLGFGHHPSSQLDISFHDSYHEKIPSYDYQDDEPPAYAVPKGCEYCGAHRTKDCPKDCRRPRMFFQNKRPPFAPPDPAKWDPETDLVVRTPTVAKPTAPHNQRNWS